MSKKILGLAPCPVGWGVAWLIPENIHLLHLCYRAKFGSFWSNHTIAFTEIPAKISRFAISWSLKVTETDTDRSATYDFLLVIHSNYGRILCHFLDKRQFRSIFPTPVYLMPQLKGFPLEARGLKWSHSYQIGGTGVSGLVRGLATLSTKVDPGAFSGQRQGWKTPRGPPGSVLLTPRRSPNSALPPHTQAVHCMPGGPLG